MDESIQKQLEEALPNVGRFQRYADAMLRGAAITLPSTPLAKGGYIGDCRVEDANGRVTHACAYYAMSLGLGGSQRDWGDHDEMRAAYEAAYRRDMVDDYEVGAYTREQIAARIAAL